MTERMTIAQLKRQMKAEGKGKRQRVMGTKRAEVGGEKLDSTTEARHYRALLIRQRAGQISGLERQVSIELLGRDGPILTPGGNIMRAVIDFRYQEMGRTVWADAKGWQTDVSKIKFAILAAMGIDVLILR